MIGPAASRSEGMRTMAEVFINYRRRDEAYAAALLDEKLSQHFGSEVIFRASRSIVAGADYELAILRAVEQCKVMVVLIGPSWSAALNDEVRGRREDWVRREIIEAFKREVPVIPVLLSGATRLGEDDVSPDIAWITRSQYLRFDYRNLGQDSAQIAHELRRIVPGLPSKPRRSPRAILGFRRYW